MRNSGVLEEVIRMYSFGEKVYECEVHGNGHINDTYSLSAQLKYGKSRFILQRMNHNVFQSPIELMENIYNVTTWLDQKIRAAGGNAERETLHVIQTIDGKNCYQDSEGQYWRAYPFIENTYCLEQVRKPEDLYMSALTFGKFQRMLSDFPAASLYETIPDFHDTEKRFCHFEDVLETAPYDRRKKAEKEIDFALKRKEFAHLLIDMQKTGELPLRVTHNDTKLNNILFDRETGEAICVIDLDTVMPGLSVNDFGDSIRFGANTAAEDEKDLTKVSLDLELYEAYTKGFIEGCAGSLTDNELANLSTGAMMMTFECGIRFLTDYLEGDCYFKIHREGHNLDRCRTQFELLKSMEEQRHEMDDIVKKYC